MGSDRLIFQPCTFVENTKLTFRLNFGNILGLTNQSDITFSTVNGGESIDLEFTADMK